MWGASFAAAQPAPDGNSVLILGSSVTGGIGSLEATKAIAQGFTVVIDTDAAWAARSTTDFASFKALIIGDPTCQGPGPYNPAAEANNLVWGPAVTGNIVLIGTDPTFHSSFGPGGPQGGDTVANSGIAFAAADPTETGLYLTLSCYYHGTAALTPVPVLAPFGVFTATGVGCYDDAHIVAAHPALAGLTDASLSNWSCSVHEAFDSFPNLGPTAFLPLVIAENIAGPGSLNFADGSFGVPYILARGKTLTPLECGNGVLQAPEQCDDGNTVSGDGCSAQCTIESCGNGTLDVGEPCDLSSPSGAFACPPAQICTPACTCSTPGTTSTSTTSTPTTTVPASTTTLPDHFQCYEAKPASFSALTVQAEDQFGTLTLQLRYPHRLCAPADKNGEGIQDPTEHLAGYKAKGTFSKRLNQTVVDQFGTLQLDVVRPELLLVPTAKNGVPLAPPPGDHFTCYKVKRTRGAAKFAPRTVTVEDQFQSVTETVIKPVRLCAPANKNGEDPTAPAHPDHLLCYKTKATIPFGDVDVSISNQFGPDQLRLIHRRELCVPSLKNPAPTTTSTTQTPTTTSSSTTQTPTTTSSTTTTVFGSPSGAFIEAGESPLE
jgi:cysteine-rich repeat protein